ncbi:MAG: hypothetical protein B7Z82_02800 [Halothiobacillus sp. 20-54-6]|nr:MAG: hypothetical protein B7Z82_02800 [Halothiobacillus sp. 20-54-6]
MMNPNTGQTGFTLLELLVAIAIFALVAVMAYGGLNTVIMQSCTKPNRAINRHPGGPAALA